MHPFLQSYRWALPLVFGLFACNEQLDLYAPEQDIYVVYAALDPAADTQYIRVAKVFQPEGDAYAYAAQHDPGMAGLSVEIQGAGHRYVAQWQDSIAKDTLGGDFGPYTGTYRLLTPDTMALQPGQVYRLRIFSPSDSGLLLQAETRIPPRPKITTPRVSVQDDRECLPILPIQDSVFIYFQRNAEGLPTEAYGYQLSLSFRYRSAGLPRTFVYGPTRLFSRSTGCRGPSNFTLCYRIGEGHIMRRLQRHLEENSEPDLTYLGLPKCKPRFSGYLSDAIQIEIIAVDSALGQYLTVNRPYFRSLNPVPPEFTNLEGSHRAVGVFGSLSRGHGLATLSPCIEYQLGWVDFEENPCE